MSLEEDFQAIERSMRIIHAHRRAALRVLRDIEHQLAEWHMSVPASVMVGDYRLSYARHADPKIKCWCLQVSHPKLDFIPTDTILSVMMQGVPDLLEELEREVVTTTTRMRQAVTLAESMANAIEKTLK